MIPMIITALMFIYGLSFLSKGFINVGVSVRYKAFSAYYVLFLPYLNTTQALLNSLLINIIVSASIVATVNFFCSSNHLVISSDILFFLNALILVLYSNLKIAETHPAR